MKTHTHIWYTSILVGILALGFVIAQTVILRNIEIDTGTSEGLQTLALAKGTNQEIEAGNIIKETLNNNEKINLTMKLNRFIHLCSKDIETLRRCNNALWSLDIE